MMKLLAALLFLVLGGVLGWLFLADNGYVLIAWQQTSVEMSLVLAVILLIVAAVLSVIALELVLGLFGLRALVQNGWGKIVIIVLSLH